MILLLFQGEHVWHDGTTVAFQNWFYPNKDFPELHSWTHNYYNTDQYSNHLYYNNVSFQPQYSDDRQCVVDIMTVSRSLQRKWIKVPCSQNFTNVIVGCQTAAGKGMLIYGEEVIKVYVKL